MGSHTGFINCPKCENEMQTCEGYDSYPHSSGNCFECGFYYFTQIGTHDLEDLNEVREEQNEMMDYEEGDDDYLQPLKSLPMVKGV